MGRSNGGTNNSSFNGRSVNWQKTKRIKARVTKKRVGSKQKHLATAVKAVSGKRTKKHQKKVERQARLKSKEEESLQASMDIDKVSVVSKKSLKKKAAKKIGTAAAVAATPMQE